MMTYASAATRGPERFRAPEPRERDSALRSVMAAFLLVLIVVGLPVVLLVTLGLPPVPHDVTAGALGSTVSVDVILGVLEWVLWLAWLQFTICTLVEALSALRGSRVPRHVPLSGTVQGIVRKLVITALLLSSSAAPALAAPVAEAPTGPGSVAAAALDTEGHRQVPPPPPSEQDLATQGEVTYTLGDTVLDPEVGAQLVGQRVYVVQAPQGHYHDNLWDIAERHLGDGRSYQEIYDLNVGREQPDGRTLELARLIQPNWYLIMPESATTVPRVEATVTPAPAPPAGSEGLDGARTQQGGAMAGAEGVARQYRDIAPAQAPAIGALTAASLLALIVRRRRYGLWGLPGAQAGELERHLRIGEDPQRVLRLDQALRSLSGLGDPPVLYAAAVTDSAITLLLTRARPQAPSPWHSQKDGQLWVLDADAELPPVPREPARVGVGLVTLGRDEGGADVLVDLSLADGDVAVGGDPSAAAEVVCALALELCTNPWSQRVRVSGVGLPATLHEICGRRLESVPSLALALGPVPPPEVLDGRRWRSDPHIVLTTLSDGDAAGRRDVTLVRTGGGRARWSIEVDSAGSAKVNPLGVSVRVTRATEADLVSVRELLLAENSLTGLPGDGSTPQPPASPAALRSAPVRVEILGPSVVHAPGPVDSERQELLTEIVACLALHRDGLHPQVLGAMIWPLGVTGDVIVSTIERLRGWLGRDEDGAERLREDTDGRIHLGPDVVVDWDVLRSLLDTASRSEGVQEVEALRGALRLVRGPLCGDPAQGRYSWLARVRASHDAQLRIVQASLRLAELLGDDDPEGAALAVSTGLKVVPLNQELWRADLRLAAARGTEPLAARVSDLLSQAGADDLQRVDPVTAALVDDLAPGRNLGVRRVPA